jgi:DNA-binding CsgD family transcriptional regulator
MAEVARLRALESPIAHGFAEFPACVIDLARGDVASARKRLDRMAGVASLGITQLTIGVLWARARAQYLDGEVDLALASLAEAEGVTGELFEPTRPDRLALCARCAAALGDDERLDRVRHEVVTLLALGGETGIAAVAALTDALISVRAGRFEQAAGSFEEAAKRWEEGRRFVPAADTWCDVADAAARSPDAQRSRAAIERALTIAEPRGLTPVIERVGSIEQAALRGQHSILDALSPREQQIAKLVAVGKTNREIGEALFISEHTVRNQLVSVFDKLGVSRRTELTRLLASSDVPLE